MPSTVGGGRASSAGVAAAAQIVPMVVSASAVASTRPGFSTAPAAPPAPRSLYDTQRVSSSWLTAAAATPTAATWPRAAARRAAPARAASPLPLHHDAGDAAAVHPLDHDLVSVEGKLVPGAGHASQHEIHQASHRGDLGVLERAPERLRQVVQRDPPVHPVAVSVLPDGGGLPDVVLVVNL